jgi:hypothetical protein
VVSMLDHFILLIFLLMYYNLEFYSLCSFLILINVLGNVSIQNVLNATRIYINPSMPEAVAFKEGYV